MSLKLVSIAVKLITVLFACTELLRNIVWRPPGPCTSAPGPGPYNPAIHPAYMDLACTRTQPNTCGWRAEFRIPNVRRVARSARCIVRTNRDRQSEWKERGTESKWVACLPPKGESQCQSEPVSLSSRPTRAITVNALNASESNLPNSFSCCPGLAWSGSICFRMSALWSFPE